jgi:hypothetical protein
MGLKQDNIHDIGATAGPTPEFYRMTFNVNRADSDIFGMAMKTFLKRKQISIAFFRLLG